MAGHPCPLPWGKGESSAVFSFTLQRWSSLIFLFIVFNGSLAGPLNWQTNDGFRSASLPVPKAGKTGFTLIPCQRPPAKPEA